MTQIDPTRLKFAEAILKPTQKKTYSDLWNMKVFLDNDKSILNMRDFLRLSINLKVRRLIGYILNSFQNKTMVTEKMYAGHRLSQTERQGLQNSDRHLKKPLSRMAFLHIRRYFVHKINLDRSDLLLR